MIKSKHFRKDVIIARVIFLILCALIIAGVVWGISKITRSNPQENPSESGNVQETQSSESESISETESEPESESESETESETQTPPSTEEIPKLYAQVISKSNLNLRKEANTTSAVLISIPNGTKVEIIEEFDGWFKVSYKGHIGYISSSYVKVVEE